MTEPDNYMHVTWGTVNNMVPINIDVSHEISTSGEEVFWLECDMSNSSPNLVTSV